MKAAGLCALVALAATLAGRGEVLAQVQQAPKPTVPVEAPKPPVAAEAPKPKPSAQELKRWRQSMVHAPPPEGTCFVAEYPATAWTNVPCGKPPKNLTHQLGGPWGLPDFQAATSPVKSAEGSFDSVIGVHSACSAACVNGTCQRCTNLPNNFSLQLNTNIFPTRVSVSCNNNPKWNCQGWEQFVFSNRYCEGNAGQGEACAYIEYWLFGYDPQHNTCPSGYKHATAPPGLTSGCVATSEAVNLAPLEVADLGVMTLNGGVAGTNLPVKNDWVVFTYLGKIYQAVGDNRLTDLGRYWTQTEFNVFGIGNGDRVLFNPGSTLVVRIEVDNGTANAPTCQLGGYGTSGESNNLNPIVLPTGSTDAPNT